MSKEKSNKKAKGQMWKKVLLTVICVILALILLAAVFATVYINRFMNNMNRVDPETESVIGSSALEELLATDPDLETIDPNSTEELPDISDLTFPTEPPATLPPTEPSATLNTAIPTEPVATTQPTEPEKTEDHYINILLIGQDRRPGQGRQRSDSMILVTVNKSKNTITLTSFMRDQYVQIPGYNPHKLNHAYQYGGMKLLDETLRVNFGVRVDGNVEVDLSGFAKVIDLLGGVEVNLTAVEARYISSVMKVELKEGVNLLNGEQATCYSQLREIDSDYRRAERQRNVIVAILNKYKSHPVDEMLSLAEQILPLVTTDMSNSEILGYIIEMFPMLPQLQINTMRIPVDGTFQQGNVKVREGVKNWFQYNIDFAANKKVLQQIWAE